MPLTFEALKQTQKGALPIMKQATVKAPAKLNLALDITGINAKGYHLMKMIMQSISLYDTITVTELPGTDTVITCSNKSIPCNHSNICYRCADVFWKAAGMRRGIRIDIQKIIPQQAGMAGGSTDGAGVLLALNQMFDTGFSIEKLCALGETVGADIPFCLTGGTALVEGIGEVITKIPDIPSCTILVAKPKSGISTQKAFAAYDQRKECPSYDCAVLLDAVDKQDITLLAENMFNVLEPVCGLAEIPMIKNIMKSYGAKGAIMTGSGSAVFGIFTDRKKAYDCERNLKARFSECFLCTPITHGCLITDKKKK